MADISLIVATNTDEVGRDVANLKKEVSGLGPAATKTGVLLDTAFKKALTTVNKKIAASKRLENQQSKEFNSYVSFSKRMQAQKTKESTAAQRDTKKVADEEERLRVKYVQGYAAMNVYSKELNDLSVARKKDIISAEQQSAAVQKLNTHMKAGTGVFANFGTAAQQGGRHMSRTGVLTQQAGYQVGDFLVQIQGGTNPMVAFGQQATQLVGALYMLPSATIAAKVGIMGLSVSVGALIAAAGIIIPLVTAIGAAWMRTRKPAEEAKSTYEGVKDALEDIKRINFSSLGEEFLYVARDIKKEFQDILGVIDTIAKRKLRESLENPLKAVLKEIRSFESKASLTAQIGGGVPDFASDLGLKSLNEAVFLATQLKRLNGETKEELQGQLQSITEALKFRGLLTEEVQVMLGELASEVSLVEDVAEAVEKAEKKAKDLKDALILSDSEYQTMLQYQLYAETMAIGLGKAADEAGRLKSNLTNSQFQTMLYYQQYAETRGQAPDEPVKPSKTPSGLGSRSKRVDPQAAALEAYNKLVATYDEVEAKALKVAAAQKTLNEAESLGVITSQQSKDALEAYTRSLEDAKSPMLDLANTASQSLSSAFMAIVDGSKSASDAFKDMASAIIKQAFEMAVINPIINSLFGGVSGFSKLPSFFANGGAFSGGSQIKAYADGGVVGGPTFFPMSGGNTGLMGEAGPEAIMPLKRGANGKLGVQMEGNSGGSVVINQSFNFQANGDDSVKRIIASEAPKIASMTQRQIMDQRRRGGAMKSAFG